jgi:hypothetical protein
MRNSINEVLNPSVLGMTCCSFSTRFPFIISELLCEPVPGSTQLPMLTSERKERAPRSWMHEFHSRAQPIGWLNYALSRPMEHTRQDIQVIGRWVRSHEAHLGDIANLTDESLFSLQ